MTIEAGGIRQMAQVCSSEGYAATHDYRLHFGLGDAEQVDRVEVRWPGGAVQVLERLEARKVHCIQESVE